MTKVAITDTEDIAEQMEASRDVNVDDIINNRLLDSPPPAEGSSASNSSSNALLTETTSTSASETEEEEKVEGNETTPTASNTTKSRSATKAEDVVMADEDEEDEVASPNQNNATSSDTTSSTGTSNENGSNDDNDTDDDVEEEEEEPEEEEWEIEHKLPADTTTICCNDDCPNLAVATWCNRFKPQGDPWHSCLECQTKDFDVDPNTGWPDDVLDLPVEAADKEGIEASPTDTAVLKDNGNSITNASANAGTKTTTTTAAIVSSDSNDDTTKPSSSNHGTTKPSSSSNDDTTKPSSSSNDDTTIPSSSNDDPKNGADGADAEEGGQWNLMAILGASQIRKEEHRCESVHCGLVACSIWVQEGNEAEPWYSCLDCQEHDFAIEGFGPDKDLPLKVMAAEHKSLIAKKCTRNDSPKLPNLPEPAPKPDAVTPPPGKGLVGGTTKQSKAAAAASSKGSKAAKSSAITPSPVPPRGAGGKKTKAATGHTSAVHKKWQEAAEKVGGPSARIIVSKSEAKKVIFDMLHDSFHPMNVTEIFNTLKSTVPSMILKSCLDDMALDKKTNPFDEDSSDDEDEDGGTKKKKKSGDSAASTVSSNYAGALTMKAGRNVNNTLYFVNHNSSYVPNSGNGLPPDERNDFLADFESRKSELMTSQTRLRDMSAETAKLLSEPTNEAMDEDLDAREKEMESLKEELEASRSLKDNEMQRRKMAKNIDTLTATWRKRKRICNDFLISMEEMTEGSVSAKKCMSGDGQIDIDGDENVAAGAVEMRKNKKSRKTFGGGMAKMSTTNFGATANPDFVGVLLTSSGTVSRVIVDQE